MVGDGSVVNKKAHSRDRKTALSSLIVQAMFKSKQALHSQLENSQAMVFSGNDRNRVRSRVFRLPFAFTGPGASHANERPQEPKTSQTL